MAKSTNSYFENIQSKCMKNIESLIAEINDVSLSVVRGKVMDRKALKKALTKSGSEIWKDKYVAPSSSTFKIRYATMVVSYVFANIEKFTRVYFSVVMAADDIKKVPVNKVVENIMEYLFEMCDSAVGPFDARFYDVIYMFAIMDTVANPYVDDKRKRLEKIHNSLSALNIRLRSDDSEDDSTFGGLFRLTYIFCTKVPSAKKAKFFVEGYEFDQKATTYRMIEKLGKVIIKTCKAYSISEMYIMFMDCGPRITSRYKAVATNTNLTAGSISLSYMKFLNNGTPVGDLCFWLK